MSTLNEIRYGIYDKLRLNSSDDDDLSLDEIEYEIRNTRSQFLRNELNRNRSVDPALIQSLGCLELEIVDSSECCSVTSDCSILRTKLEIPKTIELHHKTGLTRVGPVDRMGESYSLIEEDQATYAGNGKYNRQKTFTFLGADNKLYVFSKDGNFTRYLKYINAKGIFEDPSKVAPFTDCSTGSSCFSKDDPYPVSSWMINSIEAEVINKFAKSLALPVDNSNNAASDPKPTN